MSDSEIIITEKDVIDTMDLFTKVPSILLRRWVSKNSNLVKSFQSQMESYKNRLSSSGYGPGRESNGNAGRGTSGNSKKGLFPNR